jgi:hypothetical protein
LTQRRLTRARCWRTGYDEHLTEHAASIAALVLTTESLARIRHHAHGSVTRDSVFLSAAQDLGVEILRCAQDDNRAGGSVNHPG